MTDFIEESVYKRFVEEMPIVCVDVLIHSGSDILFILRNQEPAKGKWWVVGGSMKKNETMEQCAIRKCKEEVGLDVVIERRIGVYDAFFDTGSQGCSTHTVCVTFLARSVGDINDFIIDSTSDDGIVANAKDLVLDWYIKRLLVDSGMVR